MIRDTSYKARQFNLKGLKGISDQTLEMHFKLYDGYVNETNNLNEKINEFLADGKVNQEEVPAYSELTRRMGFEYNGMVLHEYYSGNLTPGGIGDPSVGSPFGKAAEDSFGSYFLWKADFIGVGRMRGVPGFSLFHRSGSRTANPTSQGISLRGLGASGACRAIVPPMEFR